MRKNLLTTSFLLAALALPVAAFAQDTTPEPTAEMESSMGIMDMGMIELGQTVEGELTEDVLAVTYELDAEEGTTVDITLISEDFDCYLVLEDADGNVLATDDDGAGNLDSQISGFELPEGGPFVITVQSYNYFNGNGGDTGDYELSVNAFEEQVIEYSQSIDGDLTESELTALYTFTGSEGDTIIAQLQSDDFDSYLTLSDPNGNELISNDDGGGNLNSLIGPFVLPSTGEYTLSARSLSGTAVGSYTLILSRATVESIDYGDETEIELSDSENIAYLTFEGTAGDVISIAAESEDVDTNLTLNDPSNYNLTSDEDGGSGSNPEINDFVLTQTGTFTILVGSAFGETGTVTVTLEQGELPTLDDGAQELTFNDSRTNATLSFEGEAGTSVRLTLEVLSDTASPSIDITQNGVSLTYLSGSSLSEMSVVFDVLEDGQLILSVNEYSYNSARILISLETISE